MRSRCKSCGVSMKLKTRSRRTYRRKYCTRCNRRFVYQRLRSSILIKQWAYRQTEAAKVKQRARNARRKTPQGRAQQRAAYHRRMQNSDARMKLTAKQRAYRQQNAATVNAQTRCRRAKNRDKERAKWRAWVSKNRARYLRVSRAWKNKNREKINAAMRRRRKEKAVIFAAQLKERRRKNPQRFKLNAIRGSWKQRYGNLMKDEKFAATVMARYLLKQQFGLAENGR